MNPFAEMCNDEVFIIKPNGVKSGPQKSALSPDQVEIFNESLDVDEGDTVMRELPNGKTETYTVLEVNFTDKFHAIPACYSLKIRKDSSLIAQNKVKTTNIHISHSQGFQIGDHNVQNIIDSFKTLACRIEDSEASDNEKREAKTQLRNFIENPLVCSILGSAVGSLLAMLS